MSVWPDGWYDDTDDTLSACGDIDDPQRRCADDQVAALVLFADVEFTSPTAVERRVAEWQELFGAT